MVLRSPTVAAASLADNEVSGSRQESSEGDAESSGKDRIKGRQGSELRHFSFPSSFLTEKKNITGLPGGRACGVLVLLAMSLCSAFLYGRMYVNLLPLQLEKRGSARNVILKQATKIPKGHKEPLKKLTLKEAVENVAGAQRSIIFCSTSAAYLDFTENWYASVDKFNYGSRVLFIAEDVESLNYLSRRWPSQVVMVDQQELGLSDSAAEETPTNSTYGSAHYNSLVDRRPEYFKALIDLQVSFLYNDVDIVWLRDPYPFFTGAYDMWVQEDAIELQMQRFKDLQPAEPVKDKLHAICTCFMFVQPTRASRRLLHRWSRHVRAKVQETGSAVLNQPAFNKALSLTPERDIKIGVLPVLTFPSGYIFFRCAGQPYCKKNWHEREMFWAEVKRRKSWPVMVHNNWLEGHALKLARFKEYDLWLLSPAQQENLQHWRGTAHDDG